MIFKNNNVSNNSGFVLITTMLFLSILSLLVLCMLEVNLLENKTSVFFQDKVYSFYQAEGYLLQAEEYLLQAKEPSCVSGTLIHPNVECFKVTPNPVVSTLPCKIAFYRLRATADYQEAKSILWSTFLKIDDAAKCGGINLIAGRQAFWIES